MNTFITSLRQIGVLTLALFFALLANFAYGQWDDPTGSPTSNNEPAPINVSGSTQTKSGNLNLGNSLDVNNNVTLGGRIAAGAHASVGNYVGVTGNWPSVYLTDANNGNRQGRFTYNGSANRFEFENNGSSPLALLIEPTALVAGSDVHATRYCDRNGNNCFTSNEINSGSAFSTDYTNRYFCDETNRDCLNYYRLSSNGGTRVVEFNHRATDNTSNRSPSMQLVVQDNDLDSQPTGFARFANQVRANEFCEKNGSNCFEPADVGGAPDISNVYRFVQSNQGGVQGHFIANADRWDMCFLTTNLAQGTTDAGGCAIDEPGYQGPDWTARTWTTDSGSNVSQYCFVQCVKF